MPQIVSIPVPRIFRFTSGSAAYNDPNQHQIALFTANGAHRYKKAKASVTKSITFSDADTRWIFRIYRESDGLNLQSSVFDTIKDGDMAVLVATDLLVDQNQVIADGEMVILEIETEGTPTSLNGFELEVLSSVTPL